ncbi:MAG: hypothetical protein ACREM9_03685 [Gemmatimonadales bacterium]
MKWTSETAVPVVLVLALVPAPMQAQRLQTVPTPIDVTAAPQLVVIGAEVELRGTSVALKDRKQVTLTVQPPTGPATTLQAELDAEGAYSVSFVVEMAGKHVVTATSPDGKNKDTAGFQAATPASVSHQAANAAGSLLQHTRQQTTKLTGAVAQMPASPSQQELEERLAELETRLAGAAPQLARLREAMDGLDKIVERYPEAYPEFAPIYQELADMQAAADPLADDLSEQVAELAGGITQCDRMDWAGEALNFVGLAFSLIGSASQVAIGLLADKTFSTRVSARIPALARDSKAKFAFDNSVKHSVTLMQGFEAWRGGVHTYVGDVATFAMQEAFGVYCEKFEGPVEARLHLEYLEGNQKWLAYDVELTGMLFLRYEKGKGSPIPVTGEFEGKANFSRPWENLIMLEPQFKPHVFAHWARPPALGVVPYLPEAGKVGRGALGMLRAVPGYFFVPVEGMLEGDKLMLRIKPATQDYDERAKGWVAYVLWSPQVWIPVVKKFDVKYQGAYYILSRGTHQERGAHEQPFPLQVTIDKAKKISTIQQRFTRKEHEPGNFLLTWDIDLKACNPACPY